MTRTLGYAYFALDARERGDVEGVRAGDALELELLLDNGGHKTMTTTAMGADAFDVRVTRADDDARWMFRASARGGFASAVAALGPSVARVEAVGVGGVGDGDIDRVSSDDGESRGNCACRVVCVVYFELADDVVRAERFGSVFGRVKSATARALSHAACDWSLKDEDRHARAMCAPIRTGFCGVIGCHTHVGDRKATLSATLEALRPELKTTHAPISPATPGYLCAGDLPEDVLQRILGFLDAKCASALAMTCRGFRSRVDETSAELALTLHPHQRAALGWMRRRERARLPSVIDPVWRRLRCKEDGSVLWLNTLRGEVRAVEPETYGDSPGGMLCDEPGLGKTVTILALVLARRGWRPNPPSGHTARQSGESWYYEETAALTNDAYGSPSHQSVPKLLDESPGGALATPPAKSLSSGGRGNSSGLRRSKRSGGNTPVGYFAAVHKDGLYGTTMVSSAKRSRVEAKRAHDALAASTIEGTNPAWQTRLECGAFAAPLGFIARDGLRDDSARLKRNTSHFESVLRNCVLYIGRAVVVDVVDYILENTVEVSHAMPLSMPLFRRNDDQPPVFRALGLERKPEMARLENSIPYGPPGTSDEDLILDKRALYDAIRIVDNRGGDEPTRVWLSSATLVVVPSVLIAHWLQQIAFCASGTSSAAPRVAVLDKRRKSEDGAVDDNNDDDDDDTIKLEHDVRVRTSARYTAVDDLASFDARELANEFDVVIMTLDRLSSEFTNIDTPLLRIFWQRVILDEGHQLSKTLAITNRLSVACALKAHARWLMTGTPTPTTLKGAGTAHLQPLLNFLRHPPYGAHAAAWTHAVQRPLEGSDPLAQADAVERLGDVLRRCMVRTCKCHIALPPLSRSTVMLPFSDAHAESYNGIVAHVKRSLLLADWGDPNHVQSLLHPKNVREASVAVNNLREAACVVGRMPVKFDPVEFEETIRDVRIALEKRNIRGDTREERVKRICPALVQCKGACDLCLREVTYPMVTPCAHVLCCACVLHDRRSGRTMNDDTKDDDIVLPEGVARAPRGCPVCGSSYEMQDATPNETNAAPLQRVPQDLIELQPSYQQLGWSVSEGDEVKAQGTSSKLDHLLMLLRSIGCAADAELARARDERDQFFARDALGTSERVPGWRGTIDLNAVSDDSGRRRRRRGRLHTAAPIIPREYLAPGAPYPKKCIIYSNFSTHVHAVDLALTGARVPFETLSRLGLTRRDKDRALARFRANPDVTTLIVDQKSAEGLDLSFASVVVLMEPLSNASLEAQVVSRAHRMGQKDEVRVYVLAMRGTAEETLLEVQTELRGKKNAKETPDDDDGLRADVAPTVATEALSRRRILERLQLVSSNAADAAAEQRAHAVREHFERLERADASRDRVGGGRTLGSMYKKFEIEERRQMRDAIEASVRDMSEKAMKQQRVETIVGGDEHDGEARAEPWNLRIRDPNDSGVVKSFTLPNGGKTTASAMQARIAQRLALSSIDAYVISCGFPPRALEARHLSTSIALLGVRDNDLISLRDAKGCAPEDVDASADGASVMAPAIKTTEVVPSVSKTNAKKRRQADAATLDAAVRRRLSAQLRAAETSADVMLQDPDANGADGSSNTGAAMSVDLLRAAEAMAKNAHATDPTVRSLQDAFKAIIDERAQQAEGDAKVSAARAGAVTYTTLADGRIVVKYSAPDVAQGKLAHTERSDCVADVPASMLAFILAVAVADGNSRANLAPSAMAVASPRVFWSVVRHGGVGPDVSFAQALKRLAPTVANWDALSHRERVANPKYADYDTTDGPIDEFG